MLEVFKKKGFSNPTLTSRQSKSVLKKVDILRHLLKNQALKEMKVVNVEELRKTKEFPDIEELTRLKEILMGGNHLSDNDLKSLNSYMAWL